MFFFCWIICLPLQTKDITQTPSAECSVSVPFLPSSGAETSLTWRKTGKILFQEYISVASCVTRVSHSKNSGPLPCTASSCQATEEPKMLLASTNSTEQTLCSPNWISKPSLYINPDNKLSSGRWLWAKRVSNKTAQNMFFVPGVSVAEPFLKFSFVVWELLSPQNTIFQNVHETCLYMSLFDHKYLPFKTVFDFSISWQWRGSFSLKD